MIIAVNPPKNHHAQPAFYLSGWTGPDGRVCEFSRRPFEGSIQHKRKAPAGTGYVPILNSIRGLPPEQAQVVETHFMSPLDRDAADALRELVAGRCAGLSSGQRRAWSRFIVSLLLRVKEAVELLKDHSGKILAAAAEELGAHYAGVRGVGDPSSLKEYADASEPYAADLNAFEVLTDSIVGRRLNDPILRMQWLVRDISRSVVPLVTSDRPIFMPMGFADAAALVALPISPKHLFIAAFDLRAVHVLLNKRPTQVAKIMNREVIAQARNYVWAIDQAELGQVEQFMSALPDRVLLDDEQKERALAAARGERA